MSFGDLSNSDRDVIRRSLAACADGPCFEDWEFRTLFGLTRPELREAACSWEAHEELDPRVALAIHNALGALLGYPHSGGGAAGYHYQEVSLRGRGSMDHVQVATRLYGATIRWLDDAHLEVGYDSGKPGREEVDGVAISYHPGRR